MNDAKVDAVEVAAYRVPTDAAEADGTLAWTSTTIVVVRVRAGGREGTGWTYGPASCAAFVAEVLSDVVMNGAVFDVTATWQAMVRAVRNSSRSGMAGYAISAVDVALWDLKAQLLNVPLHRLLGSVREEVPCYGSGGFTTYDDEQLCAQLSSWVVNNGFSSVKMKIGESWGTCVPRDLERVQVARKAVGHTASLMVDANGAYTRKQAVRVGRDLLAEGVGWFEEPVSSDDLEGLGQIRGALPLDVAAGEYGTDEFYFRRMCEAGAVDCVQVDASRCGGVTGWLRASTVIGAHNLEVSGHCAPNLHLHLAAATPNLRHLEWFHDHARIEGVFFDGVEEPKGGVLRPDPGRPGHGFGLRVEAVQPFRVA